MKIKRDVRIIGRIKISYLPKAPDHGHPELAVVLGDRIIPVAVGDRAVALWNSPPNEATLRAMAEKVEEYERSWL